jgi:hypothetical protein
MVFPGPQTLYLALSSLVILGSFIWVIRADDKPLATRFDGPWTMVILLLLLAGRWPSLLVPWEYNPDESHLIAGALTLQIDPVFWRSVDGATAGPLDFYALWPIGSLLGNQSYLSARLTALLLIATALVAAHQAVARRLGRTSARRVIFPAVLLEAFTFHPDFLHYSTELVPVALVALAFWWGLRLEDDLTSRRLGWLASSCGFVLGSVPLAKLQAAPAAAALGLWWCWVWFVRWRRGHPHARRVLFSLIVGALVPLLIFALILTRTGQWQHAIIPYLSTNVAYIGDGLGSITTTLLEIWRSAGGLHGLFFPWLVTLLAGALIARRYSRTETSPGDDKFVQSAAILAVVTTICVLTPNRPFPHYLQLLVVPFTLAVAGVWTSRQLHHAQLFALFGLLPLVMMTALGLFSATFPFETDRWAELRAAKADPLTQVIQRYARAGEPLGFWGWTCRYYVSTQMPQATRDANVVFVILKNNHPEYYQQRYFSDFVRARPPVFVDAANVRPDLPGNLFHDVFFPALGNYIRNDYALVQTMGAVRVFVRKDRLTVTAP